MRICGSRPWTSAGRGACTGRRGHCRRWWSCMAHRRSRSRWPNSARCASGSSGLRSACAGSRICWCRKECWSSSRRCAVTSAGFGGTWRRCRTMSATTSKRGFERCVGTGNARRRRWRGWPCGPTCISPSLPCSRGRRTTRTCARFSAMTSTGADGCTAFSIMDSLALLKPTRRSASVRLSSRSLRHPANCRPMARSSAVARKSFGTRDHQLCSPLMKSNDSGSPKLTRSRCSTTVS